MYKYSLKYGKIMKKKFCFVTTGDIKKIATGKRALGMANPLHALGWDIYILMEDTPENRHRVALECNTNIHVHYFTAGSALKEIRQKNKIIKKLQPDYVYLCAFVIRNIVSVPTKCRILTEHSELQSYMNNSLLKEWRFRLTEYYSIFYSDGLLNASKYLQSLYTQRCKRIRIKKPMLYFPYAYNRNICTTNDTPIPFFKKPSDKYFLYMGRFVINYGCFTLVQAFKKIHTINPSLKLLLIGNGNAYQKVLSYIKEHNLEETIQATGYIEEEEIPTYFSQADAFLSPMNNTIQDWARCPSKLYMYLPYRKPIVTCRIGEPCEVLGEEGIYFKPSDVDSLVDAILRLAEQDQWTLDINPLEHEWEYRTHQFHQWITQTFEV